MTLASLQERRDREQALGMQRHSSWMGMNLDMDSKNAANNIGTDIAAAWPQALEHLVPGVKQLKANQDARALYNERISKLQSKPKYSRLTLEKLEETYGEDPRYESYLNSYKAQVTAREAGYSYSLSKTLNTSKNNLLNRNSLEKYTKQKLTELAPYIEGIFASGIPLVDTETGKVIELSNINLTTQELSDAIHTLSHEFFYDARFFDENGKGGPTDSFLQELKFGEKLNEAQSKILEDRVRLADQADQAETKNAVDDLISAGFGDKSDLNVDLLLNMELSLDENQDEGKPSYSKAWDALFKRVENLSEHSPNAALYLLNQLASHPRAGNARVESARVKVYKKTEDAITAAKIEEGIQKDLIELRYLKGEISSEDLAAGDGNVTDWNPTGIRFNAMSMIGEKTMANFGGDEDYIQHLRVDAMDPRTPLINPDSKQAIALPKNVRDVIQELWNNGNTYASRLNAENKPVYDKTIKKINTRIAQSFPSWGKNHQVGYQVQGMQNAAVLDFEQLTRNLISKRIPVQDAMQQAWDIVKNNLKNVTDERSARANEYFILGNAPYDNTTLGKRFAVGDFLEANINKIGDIEALKKAEGYDVFKLALNSLPQQELKDLENFAAGNFANVSKLSPSMELLYRQTGGKKIRFKDLLTNPKAIANSNRQIWAKSILAAAGAYDEPEQPEQPVSVGVSEPSQAQFEKSIAEIQVLCRKNPHIKNAGRLFINKLTFWNQDPESEAKKIDLIEHALKCGADAKLLNNLISGRT